MFSISMLGLLSRWFEPSRCFSFVMKSSLCWSKVKVRLQALTFNITLHSTLNFDNSFWLVCVPLGDSCKMCTFRFTSVMCERDCALLSGVGFIYLLWYGPFPYMCSWSGHTLCGWRLSQHLAPLMVLWYIESKTYSRMIWVETHTWPSHFFINKYIFLLN